MKLSQSFFFYCSTLATPQRHIIISPDLKPTDIIEKYFLACFMILFIVQWQIFNKQMPRTVPYGGLINIILASKVEKHCKGKFAQFQ